MGTAVQMPLGVRYEIQAKQTRYVGICKHLPVHKSHCTPPLGPFSPSCRHMSASGTLEGPRRRHVVVNFHQQSPSKHMRRDCRCTSRHQATDGHPVTNKHFWTSATQGTACTPSYRSPPHTPPASVTKQSIPGHALASNAAHTTHVQRGATLTLS